MSTSRTASAWRCRRPACPLSQQNHERLGMVSHATTRSIVGTTSSANIAGGRLDPNRLRDPGGRTRNPARSAYAHRYRHPTQQRCAPPVHRPAQHLRVSRGCHRPLRPMEPLSRGLVLPRRSGRPGSGRGHAQCSGRSRCRRRRPMPAYRHRRGRLESAGAIPASDGPMHRRLSSDQTALSPRPPVGDTAGTAGDREHCCPELPAGRHT
jgi:hypothetical protein